MEGIEHFDASEHPTYAPEGPSSNLVEEVPRLLQTLMSILACGTRTRTPAPDCGPTRLGHAGLSPATGPRAGSPLQQRRSQRAPAGAQPEHLDGGLARRLPAACLMLGRSRIEKTAG